MTIEVAVMRNASTYPHAALNFAATLDDPDKPQIDASACDGDVIIEVKLAVKQRPNPASAKAANALLTQQYFKLVAGV
jgi:hypothetical protein